MTAKPDQDSRGKKQVTTQLDNAFGTRTEPLEDNKKYSGLEQVTIGNSGTYPIKRI